MRADRINLLFAQSKARQGLHLAEAKRNMWMHTSRDVYKMLV
jgi:hypothetical protein